MKIRNGFVSNSSSTSFVITNKTNEDLSIVDFVKENPQLVQEFNERYDWNHYTQDEMVSSAVANYSNDIIPANSSAKLIYGDEALLVYDN